MKTVWLLYILITFNGDPKLEVHEYTTQKECEQEKMRVAEEILRPLGGSRFRAMAGAKNFAGTDNSLRMRIGRNKTNANYMEVVLNGLDLYDVTFAKVTKMGEMKSVKTYDNVYNDMLVSLFESHTGMYTSL